MKQLLLLLYILSIQLYAQSDETVVYGKVSSGKNQVKTESVVGLSIHYYTTDNSCYTTNSVDEYGRFSIKFPKNAKVVIATNYHQFSGDTVIVNTGLKDSIRIDFQLKQKAYVYTQLRAVQDIKKGVVQLITFDSLEYEWSRKVDLKKTLGFEYILLKQPQDDDFEEKMEDYNWQVDYHLSLINDVGWKTDLNVLRDSVVNAEADIYGKTHTIDIKSLKVPEKHKLSEKMQEIIDEAYLFSGVDYDTIYDNIDKEYMIDVITNNEDYNKFRLVSDKLSVDYNIMIPELIQLLTNTKKVGLINFNGFMIINPELKAFPASMENGIIAVNNGFPRTLPGPFQSGEIIPFSRDDLSVVAGRANHLLEIITDQSFSDVGFDTNEEYLKRLQNRWAYWLLQLQE